MFESLFLAFTALSVWTAYSCFAALVLPNSCPAGWFGVNCMYRCHCSSGPTCNPDGSCSLREICTPGFFGPGCQYLDACKMACLPEVPRFVRDHDYTTCNPNTNSRSLDVSFTKLQIFTWFRIIGRNPSMLLQFNVTINDYLGCKNMKRLLVNPTTVDVVCENEHRLLKITLTGAAVGYICEVRVSAGRNVAVRQFANQSSVYLDNVNRGNPSDVVNNVYSTAHQLCSRTNSELNPYWQITYNRPQVINYIRVLTINDATASLTNFVVSMHNKTDTITSFLVYQTVADRNYEFTYLDFLPTTSIRIAMSGLHALRLCFVETIGETVCPDNTWGIGCENDCSCSGISTCSNVNGLCHAQCAPGFYGFKCELPCLKQCSDGKCQPRSGICSAAPSYCPPGRFGPTCTNICPGSCTVCHKTTGQCLAPSYCPPGRFGPTCTNICPGSCTVCHKTTGQCLGCPLGQYGPNCVQLCPANCKDYMCDTTGRCTACVPGFYGPTCRQLCPRSCRNQECNFVTGACQDCERGVLPYCADCPRGRFASGCVNTCSPMCADDVCDFETGACLACKNGLDPPSCKECRVGRYGSNCSKICPSFCKDQVCNVNNGICVACENSLRPPNCNNCPKGTYGFQCSYKCSFFCKDSICEFESGLCIACQNGNDPPHCNDCPRGTYGTDCSQTCSNMCKDGVCRGNGECLECTNTLHPPLCQVSAEAADVQTTVFLILLAVFCLLLLLLFIFTILYWRRLRTRT